MCDVGGLSPIPNNLPSGTYRARFNVDWDCINPCGDSNIGGNGGSITDFLIQVIEPTPSRTITLEVAPTGGGEVSGGGTAIGGIICTATADQGYVFAKWYLKENGEVVSTVPTFTDNTPGDKTYVAEFLQPATEPTTSLTFNGNNQYIRIANTNDIKRTATEDYSIACWVRSDLSTNFDSRVICFRSGSTLSGYEVYKSTIGYGAVCPASSSAMLIDQHMGGSNKEWTHIVMAFEQGALKNYFYVNGEKTLANASNVANATFQQTVDLLVGGRWSDGNIGRFFNGDVANVRIYKKALTPTEVVEDGYKTYQELTNDLKNACVAAYQLTNEYTSLTLTDETGRDNNGLLVGFPAYTEESTIQSVEVNQNSFYTGRGNQQDIILQTAITLSGPEVALQSAKISLAGSTDIADLSKIKIYSTGLNDTFDERYPDNAMLLGEYTPAEGVITCDFAQATLQQGTNFLWITGEVSMQATEGNRMDATIDELTTANQTFTITNNSPDGSREILLAFKMLYGPGDQGSAGYRIPGMVLSPEGYLVTSIDQRHKSETDLPAKISVLSLRSEDGGYTWQDQAIIAPYVDELQGRGDCALVTARNGDIYAAFIGDKGIFTSSANNKLI